MMFKLVHVFGALTAITLLSACSVTQTIPGAERIMLVQEKPEEQCTYLGEAISHEGNFLTGDFTKTHKLMEGARNELRNKAHAMGGNRVHVQTIRDSQAENALGTSNVTIVGHIYLCQS